jgi:cellulose synthase/poly-beta-1,6-N-acetylglucosamine synthase-like glycosyltransferase
MRKPENIKPLYVQASRYCQSHLQSRLLSFFHHHILYKSQNLLLKLSGKFLLFLPFWFTLYIPPSVLIMGSDAVRWGYDIKTEQETKLEA